MCSKQKPTEHCANCRKFLGKFKWDMQNWNCRQSELVESPLSPLPSIDSGKTDSEMSCSTDFDDDFFDLSVYQKEKERSASFGGVTQYSQQILHRKIDFPTYFNTSLETLDSGTRRTKTTNQLDFSPIDLSVLSNRSDTLEQFKLPAGPTAQPIVLLGPPTRGPQPYHYLDSDPIVFTALAAADSPSPSSSSSSSSSTTSSQSDDTIMMDLMEQGAETSSSASTSTSSVSRFGADTFMNTPDDVLMGGGGDEMEPVPRDRCNTWPMRRPQLEPPPHSSPMIHEQIPEEEADLFGSNEQCGRLGGPSTNGSTAMLHSPDGSIPTSFASDFRMSDSPGMADDASAAAKKTTTRRNAWGNMSYAELITTAIMASPEKRLTLAQVYEWMVQNVPYFRDKGDSNSSAGWKVSLFFKFVLKMIGLEATVSINGVCLNAQEYLNNPASPPVSWFPSPASQLFGCL
ncbi:unnamed protein product [Caenorhabditis sp. 36 PRJEB53466]|nr:unnamed protein product [Caenorhabditis sp. 36 PRJEB53466]